MWQFVTRHLLLGDQQRHLMGLVLAAIVFDERNLQQHSLFELERHISISAFLAGLPTQRDCTHIELCVAARRLMLTSGAC